jgi:hypothetical protein
LINKKIVTQEDHQVLEEVIKTVSTAKNIWDKMDMDDSHILSITG